MTTTMERRALGATHMSVTALSLGTGPLGGWPEPTTEAQARATIERAWERGIRHFDTAPLYGYGDAESRLGRALAGLPRNEFTVSTKVGRLLRPARADDPEDFFGTTSGLRPSWDFTGAGVRRSLEESLDRLGLDRVDAVLLHDPDDYLSVAMAEAIPALVELRDSGFVRAIGAGMNRAAPLATLVADSDIDLVLAAGCITLLDQSASRQLLPAADERGIGVIAGGVLHQGILVRHPPQRPAPGRRRLLWDRAAQLRTACARYGVDLAAAAVQFSSRQRGVHSVVIGPRTVDEVDSNVAFLETAIPPALWAELAEIGPVEVLEDPA